MSQSSRFLFGEVLIFILSGENSRVNSEAFV